MRPFVRSCGFAGDARAIVPITVKYKLVGSEFRAQSAKPTRDSPA